MMIVAHFPRARCATWLVSVLKAVAQGNAGGTGRAAIRKAVLTTKKALATIRRLGFWKGSGMTETLRLGDVRFRKGHVTVKFSSTASLLNAASGALVSRKASMTLERFTMTSSL